MLIVEGQRARVTITIINSRFEQIYVLYYIDITDNYTIVILRIPFTDNYTILFTDSHTMLILRI